MGAIEAALADPTTCRLLRSVITNKVRIGGYPDTLGIAEAAYREGYAAGHMAALPPATEGDTAARDEGMARRIHEQINEGGSWRACSGCQESVDGYVSDRDYPYSETFKCQPGGGCSECGGIGVIWEASSYWDGLWDAPSEASSAAPETTHDR